MPSTTSSVVSRPFASSTVITPSLPTLSIALLMMSPMVESPLAEMVPTWAISLGSLVALVIVGGPNDFSSTTLRPLGPRVTFTASASVLTPLRMASRARTSNRISLAAISFFSVGEGLLLLDDAEDVFLAHHQMLLAVDLDLGAGVLREQHAVARLDVQGAHLSVLEDLPVSDGDDLALDGLLLGGIRDDDATLRLLFLLHALDDHAILQRPNLHSVFLQVVSSFGTPMGRVPKARAM